MNPFSMNFVAEFAELLTSALIHFVWQGAVFSLVLLVTVKLLDVRTARLRYLLSVGTLLTMGMAPIVTAILHHQGHSQPQHSPVEMSRQSNPMIETQSAIDTFNPTGRNLAELQNGSATPRHPRIEVYVLIAWLLGVSILSMRLAIGFGVTLWIRVNLKPLSEEFEQRVRILGDRLSVDARQRVFACVRVGQAVAVGFIRPVVLIPSSWLTQLSPQMIEAIIAHELAHIRRWDLWVNLVQRIIETLLFYHPAVWWLSSRIRLEREMCCDEIAAGCLDRAVYARSLESVARITRGNLLMAASINGAKKMNLFSRIRYLLGAAPVDAAGNWWAIGFVAMLLPFIAAVAFSLSAVAKPSVATADNDPAESQATEKIEVVSLQTQAVTVTQRYVGQIQSHRHIKIRAFAKGYLEAISVKEGERVKEGDLMFVVRPIRSQAKLDAENAEVKIAQLEFNNTKKLFDNKVVSQDELALLEAKLSKAKANAQMAAAEVEFATVKAPFDGIVDRLHQQQGSLVLEGDLLTDLSDNSELWVYFNVPEARYLEYMADLNQRKEDVQIELILANGKKFAQVGKIGAIEANFNNETGTIPFRADFPNPSRLLRNGQRGALLIHRVLKDAIVIPQRATFEVLGRRCVYVVDKDDVAHQREIVIQNELEDRIVIEKGIRAGDRIIVGGIRQVHDGEKVE